MNQFNKRNVAMLVLLGSLGVLLMVSGCGPRNEKILVSVLGSERNLATVQQAAAQEGVGLGDSTYAYCLTVQRGFTMLEKARKSDKADLEFAKECIENLLKKKVSEDDAQEVFRTHTADGWSVYALAGTNHNKIYLLVLTM